MVNSKLKTALRAALAVSLLLWAGCSDEFLREKQNYSNVSKEIYKTYEGARLRVENLYQRMRPDSRADNDQIRSWASPDHGTVSCRESRATEEFAGFDDGGDSYVDPDKVVAVPFFDRFFVTRNMSDSPYGQIRNCNEIIEEVAASPGITENQKKELLGQAYFFRGWIYFLLTRIYGGVPLVDKVQAGDVSEIHNVEVPRSSAKACIEFICKDLDMAAELLREHGPKEYGRVTAATALAVKGRALLMYASPLFNRTDNTDRWLAAYNANKAALAEADAHGLRLHNESNPGVNGSGWSHQFSVQKPDEAVFVTLHNNNENDNNSIEKYCNNPRERQMRPYNTVAAAGSGTSATVNMVDLFPMADGYKPSESPSFSYTPTIYTLATVTNEGMATVPFWENRDPRFYRTFAFPGVRWRFNGTAMAWNYGDGGTPPRVRYNGEDYALWSYVWYKEEPTADDIGGFSADGLDRSYKGVYVRKRSNDFDLAPMSGQVLYLFHGAAGAAQFGANAAPHIELRYTEILLNLAEAAVGIEKTDEALEILKRVRKRAGYDEAIAGSNFGLTNGGRKQMFAAVLYERQIEFAYEGKRFEDMRRWMLWDGGAGQSTINPSWNLTGFDGNTCTYLSVEPFNGKRRDYLEMRVKGARGIKEETNNRDNTGDPFYNSVTRVLERPAPLDLKIAFGAQQRVVDELRAFYTNNLDRRIRRGDREGCTVDFKPNFYFLGLTTGAQNNNQSLLQTVGWNDTQGRSIFFDPLAE